MTTTLDPPKAPADVLADAILELTQLAGSAEAADGPLGGHAMELTRALEADAAYYSLERLALRFQGENTYPYLSFARLLAAWVVRASYVLAHLAQFDTASRLALVDCLERVYDLDDQVHALPGVIDPTLLERRSWIDFISRLQPVSPASAS